MTSTDGAGVWFDALVSNAPPIVWCQRVPQHVVQALVTAHNSFFNLLELTGMITQHKDTLKQEHDITEQTKWLESNNRAAVAWSTKGSANLTTAHDELLRFNSIHHRTHRYYVSRH